MMTVSGVKSAGQADHYYQKADDYYRGGTDEPTSAWHGQLAQDLGLSGEVEPEQFKQLLQGQTPDGEQLGRIRYDENGQQYTQHNPGWDVTFSAPKINSSAMRPPNRLDIWLSMPRLDIE